MIRLSTPLNEQPAFYIIWACLFAAMTGLMVWVRVSAKRDEKRKAAGGESPVAWAVLSCEGCRRVYKIGDDSIAASIEVALSTGTVLIFTDGSSPKREDLVATLEDVSPDAIQGARERARPSWEAIQTSLARGEHRTWCCRACNAVNNYPPEIRAAGLGRKPSGAVKPFVEAATVADDQLLSAALDGDVERARRALDGGANVNCVENHALTPLDIAHAFWETSGKHRELVALLRDEGARFKKTPRFVVDSREKK